jgi:hypothetical protein
MVQIFFGVITRQAIRRDSFTSVKGPHCRDRDLIHSWNERCHAFTWTKTADKIPATARRKQTSNTQHSRLAKSWSWATS